MMENYGLERPTNIYDVKHNNKNMVIRVGRKSSNMYDLALAMTKKTENEQESSSVEEKLWELVNNHFENPNVTSTGKRGDTFLINLWIHNKDSNLETEIDSMQPFLDDVSAIADDRSQ